MSFRFFKHSEKDKTSYRILTTVANYGFVVKIIEQNLGVVSKSFKVWYGDIEQTISYWSTKEFKPNDALKNRLISEYVSFSSTAGAIMSKTKAGLTDG